MVELDHEAGEKLQESDEQEERKTQSDIIIELASDMTLFHDEKEDAYAKMKIDDHYELWEIRSRKMKQILIDRYMNKFKDSVPSENSLNAAIFALEAKAILRGERVTINTRIAKTDEAVYIDLCNDQWEVVKIKKDGWEVVSEPSIHFKRSKTMQKLPVPERNGNIGDLKPFINYDNNHDYKLIISWLLSTLKEDNPFPLLTIQGEQGSAKSTTSKVIRALIDPSSLPLRALPHDEQTMAMSADNNWILAYDNLSGLSAQISDSLCKMSTGGGLSVRELYTTREESIFNTMRPVILNGIDDIAKRPDLLDRSIVINLPSISEENRQDEQTFWKSFNEKQASILGGLCDAVSSGLKELPHTTLEKRPRMADYALWVTACEKGLGWYDGEFMDIYNQNRSKAIEQGIESDPFALAVVQMIESEGEWIGNASQLIAQAGNYTDEKTRNSKAFPTSRAVRNRLRRINPSLRKKDIHYEPYENRMNRTLKLSPLSSYRHQPNDTNASSHYDNNDDKKGNDDRRHTSSSNYDDKKTPSSNKAYHINGHDDNGDNYDKSERVNINGSDLVI